MDFRTTTRTWWRACAALVFLGVIGNAHAASGPVLAAPPNGTHGFPYLSSALDLEAFGFVEQEFFISGTARAYVNDGALNEDGAWKVKPGAQSKYTTRLLVRRPTRADEFNGTVVVEWLNVSGNQDASPDWSLYREELLRSGYAWVGVSAQFVGVTRLQGWESGAGNRYAALYHPGDSFSYDIYTQAASAIRQPQGTVKPLGELTSHVRALLANGESQSASRMVTYFNAVHPLAHAYDGFLIHSIGFGAALSQSSGGGIRDQIVPPAAGAPSTPDIAVPPLAHIRTDQRAPVLFVNTETEMVALGAARGVHLQPDSNGFRMWEIAGTAHADQTLLGVARPDSEKSGSSGSPDCGNPPINNGPDQYAIRAAVHALHRWVRAGIEPSMGPRLSVTIPAPPAQPSIDRDPATGLAKGGIRLPQIAVPVGTETGARPAGALAASPFCFLFGASDAWNGDSDPWDKQAGVDPSPAPEPDLRTLYPTHEDYVLKVRNASLALVAKGFLRPADAFTIVQQAEQAKVPQ